MVAFHELDVFVIAAMYVSSFEGVDTSAVFLC